MPQLACLSALMNYYDNHEYKEELFQWNGVYNRQIGE